jgi:hypothetical protein
VQQIGLLAGLTGARNKLITASNLKRTYLKKIEAIEAPIFFVFIVNLSPMKQSISIFFIASFLFIVSCTKDKYSIFRNYDKAQQDSIMASIITYIYTAPPYVDMKDRFKSQHRKFYANTAVRSQFSIEKFYLNETNGLNYFLVIRPGANSQQKRGVGGYFKLRGDNQLSGFREAFVTPIMTQAEIKDRGAFLFDKMVRGEIDEYLKMKSYVQWPNEASSYDTITYQWVLNGE